MIPLEPASSPSQSDEPYMRIGVKIINTPSAGICIEGPHFVELVDYEAENVGTAIKVIGSPRVRVTKAKHAPWTGPA